jgi:hypothetical protein
MRNFSIFLSIGFIFVSSFALADAQNFQGLRVGGNLNLTGASTKTVNSPNGDGTFGGNNVGGGITIAYSLRTSQKTAVGLGASFSNSKIKSGIDTAGMVIKSKNLWTAYLEPGIFVGDNTLFYGKAGFAGMKGSIDEFATGYGFKGHVYGLGIRTMVDEKMFVEVEAVQYRFDSKEISGTTFDIKATSANIGAGYIF